MTRTGKRVLATCGMLLVAGMFANAQEGRKPWEVSLGLHERFTDNRDGTKADKSSDWDSIVEPRVDGYCASETAAFDLFYAPSYLWRSNPRDDQNRSDFYHSAGLNVDFTPTPLLKTYLKDLFDYTDQTRITEGDTVVRADESYIWNRTFAGADCDLTERTTLGLSGYYWVKRYRNSDVADAADEDRWSGDGTLKWKVTEQNRVFVLGRYVDSKHKGVQNDVGIFTSGGGIESAFSPHASLRLMGGYQNAKPKDSGIADKNAPTVDGEILLSTVPSTRLRLDAGYSLEPSDYAPFSYQERTYASAAIERDVTASLTVIVKGLYANGHYNIDSAPAGAVANGGDDRLGDGQVSIDYKINRNLTANLGYEYEDWNSDVRESFKRNTVNASLRATL